MSLVRSLYYRSSFLKKLASPAVNLRRRAILNSRRERQAIVDHARSILVGDVTVHCPEFNGNFRINPKSELFSRLIVEGRYEPEMISLALSAVDPAADVLDVGANIGFFSVALGKRLRGGRVLAIEPSGITAERLRHNVSINGLSDVVTVHHGAAAAAPGTMTLNIVEGKEEYSSLGNLNHPAVASLGKTSESVSVDTIDNLVKQYGVRPRFMKVDVEGFEHSVFKGAKETLREHRPTILSEMTPELLASNGSSAAEVIGMISEAGYEVKDALYPDLAPGQRPLGDIICRPR